MICGFAALARFAADPLCLRLVFEEFFLKETFEPALGRLTLELFELLRLICCDVGLDEGICDFALV